MAYNTFYLRIGGSRHCFYSSNVVSIQSILLLLPITTKLSTLDHHEVVVSIQSLDHEKPATVVLAMLRNPNTIPKALLSWISPSTKDKGCLTDED